MPKRFELLSFADAEALARSVAAAWLEEIAAANCAGKIHAVALSGGRIAPLLFGAVVKESRTRPIDWTRVEIFWADERCVPPSDPESNFRAAQGTLLEPLRIPANRIHRIRGEDPPELAAQEAETAMRRVVPRGETQRPRLDLVLLGMGEDGHVASLFPGGPEEIAVGDPIYRVVRNSSKPPPERITIGYGAMAAAGKVWVLVSGEGKSAALRDSLGPSGRTPLARLLRLRSWTRIYADVAGQRESGVTVDVP